MSASYDITNILVLFDAINLTSADASVWSVSEQSSSPRPRGSPRFQVGFRVVLKNRVSPIVVVRDPIFQDRLARGAVLILSYGACAQVLEQDRSNPIRIGLGEFSGRDPALQAADVRARGRPIENQIVEQGLPAAPL